MLVDAERLGEIKARAAAALPHSAQSPADRWDEHAGAWRNAQAEEDFDLSAADDVADLCETVEALLGEWLVVSGLWLVGEGIDPFVPLTTNH